MRTTTGLVVALLFAGISFAESLCAAESGDAKPRFIQASAAIPRARGTAYVMGQVFPFNNFDQIPGQTTMNPLRWRYGYWGGSGWSDGGQTPIIWANSGVDEMDNKFRSHDYDYDIALKKYAKFLSAYKSAKSRWLKSYSTTDRQKKDDAWTALWNAYKIATNEIIAADDRLVQRLRFLPTIDFYPWGQVYSSNPTYAPDLFVYKTDRVEAGGVAVRYAIPYSEYARQQASGVFRALVFWGITTTPTQPYP